jgi:sua5/yciO/yrdC/ywlC family protein
MKYFDWTNKIDEKELKEVIEVLDNDGLVIFPTETVYGIASKATSLKAVDKLYEAKKRPRDKAINIMVGDSKDISKYAKINSEIEAKIIEEFMPGGITLILDKVDDFGEGFTLSNNTIGVRIPNNTIALKILKNISFPLTVPSANISNKPSGTEVKDIIDDFKNTVDIIIDGGKSVDSIPSTIVRVEDNKINILRQGKISEDEIKERVGI